MSWPCMLRHSREPHVPDAGAIQDVLAAASQIEKLEFLDMEGQAFSGTLPKQYNFPNLMTLNLINNNIGVRHHFSNLLTAPCDREKPSAAVHPGFFSCAGLCTHCPSSPAALLFTEPLTAAASSRPAWPPWQVAAWAVVSYSYPSIWGRASLHDAVCRGCFPWSGA